MKLTLPFLRLHYERDMSALEIAGHFGMTIAEVVTMAKRHDINSGPATLTAFHSPVNAFDIARGVKRATLADAYDGDMADWGLRI